MSREWKPGDVAMVTYDSGVEAVSVLTDRGELAALWIAGTERCWARDGEAAPRPIVVIDPEDRVQVERFAAAYRDVTGECELTDEPWSVPGLRMQAALRSLIEPPKPEVYSHLVVDKADALKESLCGKVWRPATEVTVVGKCPDCLSIANGEEWIA